MEIPTPYHKVYPLFCVVSLLILPLQIKVIPQFELNTLPRETVAAALVSGELSFHSSPAAAAAAGCISKWATTTSCYITTAAAMPKRWIRFLKTVYPYKIHVQ